jgi:hypothetical protein
MHTYGFSDDKVFTIMKIVDVIIILDKFGHGDIPCASQNIATLARGFYGDRAIGFVLSRAQMATDRERAKAFVTACWHKKKSYSSALIYPETHTQERTVYPGIHRLYR